MMQMTYGDLCFKFRRIPRPLSKIKTWVYFTLHLTNQWVWSKYPGARFSKVPIINGPGKLSPFTLKIEVSIVFYLTR